MKILYVGDKYDYGNPSRGFGYEYRNFYNTLVKMDSGSNDISSFFYDEEPSAYTLEEKNIDLIKKVEQIKPELVFFGGGGALNHKTAKIITEKSGSKTLTWISDDHWQFHKYSKHLAPFLHWLVTTDADAIPKYHKIGRKNVILSQWACNHFACQPLDLPKIYDVTFIGAAHGNRKKIIAKIKREGINVKCWGSGWPEGRVSDEEMIKIISQSKINLNFTKSSGTFWKELALIFLRRNYDRSVGINNPRRWVDNIKSLPPSIWSKQIKGRNFEIPGLGVFFLTEYVNHLEDYYKIGEEIECFDNPRELADKIKYYLAHDKEREKIAKAGRERTMKDHTYEKRFNQIFKIIGLIK
jgi:spore maturation protein CgeB